MSPLDYWTDESVTLASGMVPAARLSSLYAKPSSKTRIAGLYKLLGTVEQCLYGSSDSRVSSVKLNWWLAELCSAKSGGGTHPLSLHLLGSGALGAWSEALLNRLFALALWRIDAPGLGTDSELLDLCEKIGSIHLELECALLGLPVPGHVMIKQLTAVNGQMQLIRESFWSKLANFYWVPLTICAQMNLQRQQMSHETVAFSGLQWIPAIAQLALGNLNSTQSAGSSMREVPIAWRRVNLHWLVFSFLQQRQLNRFAQSHAMPGYKSSVTSLISRIDLQDAWASWRIARRLSAGKQE